MTVRALRPAHVPTRELLDSGLCLECGHSHLPADRLSALRRALPGCAADLRALFPCWYGGGQHSAGERLFYRDLHALGARLVHRRFRNVGVIGSRWQAKTPLQAVWTELPPEWEASSTELGTARTIRPQEAA